MRLRLDDLVGTDRKRMTDNIRAQESDGFCAYCIRHNKLIVSCVDLANTNEGLDYWMEVMLQGSSETDFLKAVTAIHLQEHPEDSVEEVDEELVALQEQKRELEELLQAMKAFKSLVENINLN